MKRDKLFDIEMYERGELGDCSVFAGCVGRNDRTYRQYTDMPLFMENQQCVSFCAKREVKSDTPEAEELILLQLFYW